MARGRVGATAFIPVCLVLSFVSCGAPQTAKTTPPSGEPAKLAALDLGISDRRTSLPPAADQYATERPDGTAALGVQSADLAAGFTWVWAKARGVTLEADHRLAELALWVAKCDADGLRIDSKLITLGAQRLGIPFADPLAIQIRFGRVLIPDQLAAALRPVIAPIPSNRPFARYGVGVVRDGDELRGVVVMSTADVTFHPLMRRVHKGAELHLDGTVAERYDQARLAVTLPEGKVVTFQTTGRQFDGRFAVPEAGTYKVELLGDGSTGPVVVANFPLYVDTPEPEDLPARGAASDDATLTAAQIEAKLLELVNAERANSSLPAVKAFDPLAAVAAAHSRDMADHSFFAHVSPSAGTTADRVRNSGVPVISFGENIGQGANALEVHQILLASPAHRATIIDPRYTHLGVGVAVVPGLGIIATELFGEIRPLEAIASRAQIVDQLSMARLTHALGAVREQADLRLAAEHGLELRQRDPKAPIEAISRSIEAELKTRARTLARAGMPLTAVVVLEARSVDDVVATDALHSPNLKFIGIAVAPPSPDGRSPQLVVLVLGAR